MASVWIIPSCWKWLSRITWITCWKRINDIPTFPCATPRLLKILPSVVIEMWRADSSSKGNGSTQSSSFQFFPFASWVVCSPFNICQRQLSMAFPCICITATTLVAATNTHPPAVKCSALPAQSSVCHTSRKWKCSEFESAGSHCHFSPLLRPITRTFLKQIFSNSLNSCSN